MKNFQHERFIWRAAKSTACAAKAINLLVPRHRQQRWFFETEFPIIYLTTYICSCCCMYGIYGHLFVCMYVFIAATARICQLSKIPTDRPYKNEASICYNILALLQSYIELCIDCELKNVIWVKKFQLCTDCVSNCANIHIKATFKILIFKLEDSEFLVSI